MNVFKRPKVLFVGLAAMLLVAACSSSKKASTTATTAATTGTTAGGTTASSAAPTNTSPIKIGVMLPLSGPLAGSSADYAPMVPLLTKEAGNTTIDGRPVQVILKDDTGTASGAASTARELIDQEKVNVILGPLYTAMAVAVLPLTNAAKIFEVAFTGCPDCGDGTKNPTAFSIEYDRPTQGPATITRLKALGQTKMAMIQSDDATGTDYANAISTAASSGGATITTTVKFTTGATDLSAQATQLKSSGAKVVYVASAVPADVINIVKAMKEISFQPILLGNSALGQASVAAAAGDTWAKTFEAAGYGTGDLLPNLNQKAIDFRNTFKQLTGQTTVKNNLNQTMVVQDAFDIVKAAIEGSHSTDGPTMAQWLVTNGFNGIRANYTFTATRHNGLTPETVGWEEPGTFVDGYSAGSPVPSS
jgi:branched-chain amino acid transport system substrate-binding protein